jgi:tRNA threonylcarbamoyladenosine biosynthesis protein TsaB
MNILAIDTSSREGAVSLSADGGFAGEERFGRKDSHLVALGRTANSLLANSRLNIKNIDRLAIVSGPGSFTGLRIGMAFVKGIHAALGIDVVTMTSLELLARPLGGHSRLVCPMIDARKSEIYTALYRCDEISKSMNCEQLLPACVISPLDLIQKIERSVEEPVLFAGSGVQCCRELIESSSGIQASYAGEEENRISLPIFLQFADKLKPLSNEEILTLEPFYIRSSDAELKRLKRHRTHERN